MIELKDVTRKYIDEDGKDIRALNNVNMSIPDKGFVVITGFSGCGKTTLLNIIGGLDRPDSGEIYFNGNRIDNKDESWWDDFRCNTIGFIYQDYNLIENISAEDNLRFPLDLKKIDDKDKQQIVHDVAKRLRIEDYLNKKAGKLSGGQKQRVAIGRALVNDSKILLADEPTGNLDEENSDNVFGLLKEVSHDRLVVVVTHDSKLAKEYADILVEIDYGKIISIERKDIVSKKDGVILENADYQSLNHVYSNKQKTGLSFRKSMSFAYQTIKNRKVRCIVSIVIFTITMVTILTLCSCVFRKDSVPLAEYVEKNNEMIIPLCMSVPFEYEKIAGGEYIKKGAKFYDVVENDVDESQSLRYEMGELYFSEGSHTDIFALYVDDRNSEYFEYYGRLPEKANEIALATNTCSEYLSTESALGKHVYYNDKEYTVSGVITKVSDVDVDEIRYKEETDVNILRNIAVLPKSVINDESRRQFDIYGFGLLNTENLFYQATVKSSVSSVDNVTQLIAGKMPEKENEVLINNKQIEPYEIKTDEIIGKKHKIYDFYDAEYKNAFWDKVNLYDFMGNEYEIVGVAEGDADYYVTPSLYDSIYDQQIKSDDGNCCMVYDKKDIIENLDNLIRDDVWLSGNVYAVVHSFYERVSEQSKYIAIVMMVFLVLTFFQMISLFSYSINDNKKTIGILRTLGVNKTDIKKIFAVESLFISILSYILAVVVSLFVINKINGIITEEYTMITVGFSFFKIRLRILLVVGVIDIAAGFLTVAVPLKKFSKKKILDLIK